MALGDSIFQKVLPVPTPTLETNKMKSLLFFDILLAGHSIAIIHHYYHSRISNVMEGVLVTALENITVCIDFKEFSGQKPKFSQVFD